MTEYWKIYLLPVFLGYDDVSIDKEVGLLKDRSSFIIGVLRSKKIFHGQNFPEYGGYMI